MLQNATQGGKKIALSSVYDKLESYIRALNSLGVTADKYAAMLYPLVESSLPEEVLRVWQRSGQHETTTVTDENGERQEQDRMTKLLNFLQMGVENQERIDMALKGFGLPTETERSKKVKTKTEITREPASASAPLHQEKTGRYTTCFVEVITKLLIAMSGVK